MAQALDWPPRSLAGRGKHRNMFSTCRLCAHARGHRPRDGARSGDAGIAEVRRTEPKKNREFSMNPSPAALQTGIAAQHVHRPKIVALQRAVAR